MAPAENLDRIAARVKPTQKLAPLRLTQSPPSPLLFHFARLTVVVDAGILGNSVAWGKYAAGLPLTARLNGHEPYAYLKDVLERLPTLPAKRINCNSPITTLTAESIQLS